jgi:hypothetical protein
MGSGSRDGARLQVILLLESDREFMLVIVEKRFVWHDYQTLSLSEDVEYGPRTWTATKWAKLWLLRRNALASTHLHGL